MYSQMSLMIGPESSPASVNVSVFCGWETASSQIRICLILAAIYNSWIAYLSVSSESKTFADRVSI